jgi:hypothetical protein
VQISRGSPEYAVDRCLLGDLAMTARRRSRAKGTIETTDDVSWLMNPEVVAAWLSIYKGTDEQFQEFIGKLHREHPEIDFKKVFDGAQKVLDQWEVEGLGVA